LELENCFAPCIYALEIVNPGKGFTIDLTCAPCLSWVTLPLLDLAGVEESEICLDRRRTEASEKPEPTKRSLARVLLFVDDFNLDELPINVDKEVN
jgi:hypothetical protein